MILATYGSLKLGYHNHPYLAVQGVTYLGTSKTAPKFTMISFGSFPAVLRGGNTAIECEVYEVNNKAALSAIYRLEGYSGIQTKYGGQNWYDVEEIETPWGKAQMFVMDREPTRSDAVVESGVWSHRYL